MNSSRPHHGSATDSASLYKNDDTLRPITQESLFLPAKSVTPGSLNDAAMIRSIVAHAFKQCTKSREQIADEMSYLTGSNVTLRMLNAYAAESREEHRFPAELARAFCVAVGDVRLLTCLAEAAGFHVIDETDAQLLALGREHLRQKRATSAISALETKLAEVKL